MGGGRETADGCLVSRVWGERRPDMGWGVSCGLWGIGDGKGLRG